MWVKTIICLNRTRRNSKILHRKSTRIITSNPFLWRTTCSRWICGRAKNSHGSCWWVRQIWQWSKGQTISAKFPSDCLGRILESCNWCLSPPRFQIKQNIFWWRSGKNQIYVFSFATHPVPCSLPAVQQSLTHVEGWAWHERPRGSFSAV